MPGGAGSWPAARHRTLVALLAACAVAGAFRPVAGSQSPQKAVLVLISWQRGSSVGAAIDNAIGTVLSDGLAGRLDYYTEYLDVARFSEPDYQPAVRDFFRRKYASKTFDVVIASTDAMIDFVNTYRDELFPGAAVVFTATSPRSGPKMTGLLLPVDMKRSIDVALQLHPDLRQVFVVSGASDMDRGYQDLARAQLRAFDGRLAFTYLSDLAMGDLLHRLARLPPHSIVYFLTFFADGHGVKFDELKPLARVAAAANAPTYTWIDATGGHGSVGGSVLNVERAATAVANLALRVLNGESPDLIPVREFDATVIQLDWRQLQRWRISETRLPPGSVVSFRQPSLWAQYKVYIVAAASVVVLQTALIAGLLVQRARRQRTENALRRSETALRQSNAQTQDLAGRLINAQEEERARIARDLHDDVSQQVAGVAIMLSGLKRALRGPHAHPALDETVAQLQERTSVVADAIRHLSHELHPGTLKHAGLVAAIEAHCAEIEKHHGLTVTCTATGEFDALDFDVSICLFRVTQEAITNIVRHAQARGADVELRRTADGVELRIDDDGVGFVTTDRTTAGLGLRSMDERVRLIGGQLTVVGRPGLGTTLRVWIPTEAVGGSRRATPIPGRAGIPTARTPMAISLASLERDPGSTDPDRR
jgi:signal transduction histidine kinase